MKSLSAQQLGVREVTLPRLHFLLFILFLPVSELNQREAQQQISLLELDAGLRYAQGGECQTGR